MGRLFPIITAALCGIVACTSYTPDTGEGETAEPTKGVVINIGNPSRVIEGNATYDAFLFTDCPVTGDVTEAEVPDGVKEDVIFTTLGKLDLGSNLDRLKVYKFADITRNSYRAVLDTSEGCNAALIASGLYKSPEGGVFVFQTFPQVSVQVDNSSALSYGTDTKTKRVAWFSFRSAVNGKVSIKFLGVAGEYVLSQPVNATMNNVNHFLRSVYITPFNIKLLQRVGEVCNSTYSAVKENCYETILFNQVDRQNRQWQAIPMLVLSNPQTQVEYKPSVVCLYETRGTTTFIGYGYYYYNPPQDFENSILSKEQNLYYLPEDYVDTDQNGNKIYLAGFLGGRYDWDYTDVLIPDIIGMLGADDAFIFKITGYNSTNRSFEISEIRQYDTATSRVNDCYFWGINSYNQIKAQNLDMTPRAYYTPPQGDVSGNATVE